MAFKLKRPTVLKLVEDEEAKKAETTTYMRNADGTSTQVNVKDTSSVLGDTEAKKLEVMKTRIKTDPKFKDYKIKRNPVTGKLSYTKIK